MNQLNVIDGLVFLLYFVVVAAYGWMIYRHKKRAQDSSADFFLAEGALNMMGHRHFADRLQHLGRAVRRHVGARRYRRPGGWPPMSGLPPFR